MIKNALVKSKSLYIIHTIVTLVSVIIISYLAPTKISPFLLSAIFSGINMLLIILFVQGMIHAKGAMKGLIVFIGTIKYLFIGLGVFLLIKFFKDDYIWVVYGFTTVFLTVIVFGGYKAMCIPKENSKLSEGI